MTEQIYINGVQMETAADKNVSMIFQSPYFTDIDNIVSSRTTTVELPATRNNLLSIEQANLGSRESRFEFNRHHVVYRRDGIQIFSGRATLLSLTPTSLKFSFVWGNVSVFQRLLDTNLRDLQTADDYVLYDESAADADTRHYPAGWNKRENWGGAAAPSIQPIMPVSDIIERVKSRFNVSMTLPDGGSFDGYHVPLIYREADDRSRARQGVVVTGWQSITVNASFGPALENPCVIRVVSGLASDPNELYGGGIIDVSDVDKLTIRVSAGFRFTSHLMMAGLVVIPVTGDTFYYSPINVLRGDRVQDGAVYRYTYPKEVVQTFDVSRFDAIALVQDVVFNTTDKSALDGAGTEALANIEIYDAEREELTFGPGAIYPLYRNLPDWTVSQFLKNLMKLEGLFAYADSDTSIRFVGVGDLYVNREGALDWTDRLILTGGLPTEKTTSYGNLCQRNWCRYAEDESVSGNFDGYIEVRNETLEEEQELVTMDFAPTAGQFVGVWRYEASDEEYDAGSWSFEEVEPRILKLGNSGAPEDRVSFDGLDWRTIIATKYRSYQNLVRYLRVIKATVRLSSLDLQQLDFTRPVYARQWGRYYAISKLTTKNNDTAEVELLRLGPATVWPETSGSNEGGGSPDRRLQLVANGDGTWTATLTNTTDEELREIVESPDYHLCLLRYGYTRRGKGGKKFDRLYGQTGTHTDRRKFREYRKKDTWRIIGHEILVRGRLSTHAQTAKSAIYRDATLVFEFGQTIHLPKIRSKARLLTSKGRIRNGAVDGLMELYVGLYKRTGETNTLLDPWGWECVSNKVQVRGRNASNTKYWEFDKTNEKSL